ncbi:lasso peptide biosynthesis B2 protein [Streptomyces bauhiniae]|nr:lasso peptide biosynthesis B2 protein [Streptomyces bauhiniae]
MNETTERIWSAALSGTLPELAARMREEGMPGDAEAIVLGTVERLERVRLVTDTGPGSASLPMQLPVMTTVAVPCAQCGPGMRMLARVGLVLALGVMRLPLRTRMWLLGGLRVLPLAPPGLVASAATAVPLIRPSWWPGRIACMEVSLATVVTIALCGRRAHWVLGARRMPNEAHAWVWTPAGAHGLSGRDADDERRPWVGVAAAPPVNPHE